MGTERVREQFTDLGSSNYNWTNQTGTPEHGYVDLAGYPQIGTYSPGSTINQTTEDVVTDNFRKRIQAGEIINNPFTSTKVVETYSESVPCTSIWRNKTTYNCNVQPHTNVPHRVHWKNTGTIRPSLPVYLGQTSSMVGLGSTVQDDAVTQAFANIDVSEMMALATVAESGKSVQSMCAILRKVFKIARNVRKLQFMELAGELKPKEVAERWMEARYALRPLIYDVKGLALALEKNRGYARRTFRGYAEESETAIDTWTKHQHTNYVYSDCPRTIVKTVSARAGVLCDVSITDITAFGLDLWIETAWELVPFSFIIDWFVSVGDWIAAHTPNAGVTQRASWVTLKTETTRTVNSGSYYFDLSATPYESVSLSYGKASRELKETVLTRSINPQIATFPVIGLKLDVFKLTDLGIILRKIVS